MIRTRLDLAIVGSEPIFGTPCQGRFGKFDLHFLIVDVASLSGIVHFDEPSQQGVLLDSPVLGDL